MSEMKLPLRMAPDDVLGRLAREDEEAPIPGATWYVAEEVGDGLAYQFPPGALAKAEYLTADLLVDGNRTVVFVLHLQEGEDGPRFSLSFSALNQCQARIRMPTEAVDQNRWAYDREGAWLKPRCGGDRVDLRRVDRMTITVSAKSDDPARFCLTPVAATAEEPSRVTEPILPHGPLLDELGQSALHEWPAKSRSPEEVTQRLQEQLGSAPGKQLPGTFSHHHGGARNGIAVLVLYGDRFSSFLGKGKYPEKQIQAQDCPDDLQGFSVHIFNYRIS